MKFILQDQTLQKIPGYGCYLVVLRGVDNRSDHPEAAQILSDLRQAEAERADGKSAALPHLIRWDEVFRSLGLGNKYSCSVSALLARVEGGKPLPDINPLVNLYNTFSIRHALPYGGENLAMTSGDACLRVALDNEEFWAIGAEKSKPPLKGEVVWADDLGITCRAINWRQSDRTRITNGTTDTYHIIDILLPEDEPQGKQAAVDFAAAATELLGGTADIHYLDSTCRSIEINYAQRAREEIEKDLPERDQRINEAKKQKNISAETTSPGDYPHQPTALDNHEEGTSTRHHVLYPGSIGEKIKNHVIASLKAIWTRDDLTPSQFPIVDLERPADDTHGDWATNVAMQLARVLRKNPLAIAQNLATALQTGLPAEVERVEAVTPGFINFHLTKQALLNEYSKIRTQGETFGQTEIRTGQTIMIEHTQPNSHKEIHIGHLRNTAIGMTQVRLHRLLGYKVYSATYGGDVGPHVAKCLWGLRGVDLDQYTTVSEKVHAIQAAYIKGTQAAATDPAVEEEVKAINKAVYQKSDPELTALWQRTRDWSIEMHKEVYERFGTYFDRYYWESEVWEKGLEEVKKRVGTVFEDSQGAVIFDGEPYGLHKRVFVTSQGTATYEAKEIGLEQLKMDEYDLSFGVIQTGTDHIDYFKVVLKVVGIIYPEMKDRFTAEHFGMVNIPSGKMSSREGNVVLAMDVLDEMHSRAYKEIDQRSPELSQEAKDCTAELIAISATKYALLKNEPKMDMIFDPDLTLSFTGDSGPYLQYVCVRIQSMIAKGAAKGLKATEDADVMRSWSEQMTVQEATLLKKATQLPEVIIRAALEYKPNYLTSYLFELAQAYNDFYQACPVLSADKDIAEARLALSESTAQVLRNGLTLLGIKVPDRM